MKKENLSMYEPGEEIRIIIHRERDPVTVAWKAEKNGKLYGDYISLEKKKATDYNISDAAGLLIYQAISTLRTVPDGEEVKDGVQDD